MSVELLATNQVESTVYGSHLPTQMGDVQGDQQLVATDLNPRYKFDQFVIGRSNHVAHAAALAVAEQPAQALNPLFIYGEPCAGKTPLVQTSGK